MTPTDYTYILMSLEDHVCREIRDIVRDAYGADMLKKIALAQTRYVNVVEALKPIRPKETL